MKGRYIKCSIYVSVILIIVMTVFYILHRPAKTDINYCKEIAHSINLVDLKCYRCATIERQNSEIEIFFSLKKDNLYYENTDLGIYDMITVKNYLEDYMLNNPQNPLNGDKIRVCFQTHPGDAMFMYNYDYRKNKIDTIYDNFLFFDNVESKHFSALKNLNDVYVIKIYSENIDSLDFWNRWRILLWLKGSVKLKTKIKVILKFLFSFFVVILFFYLYVGGYMLGGLVKHEINPVSKKCAEELMQACHIILPENVEIDSICSYSWGSNTNYILVQLHNVEDVNEIVAINETQFTEETYRTANRKIIGGIRSLNKYSLYNSLKYMPDSGNITILFDSKSVYLSVDSMHIYGKDAFTVFNRYYKP